MRTLLAIVLLLAVSGCSMESARYRRAARSSFEENVKMSQSTRPVDRCKVWDGIHVYGDWVAGGLASTAAIAGGLAVQTESRDFSKGMMWTAVGTGAVSAFALGWAEQSASSWVEAGCGQ